LVGAKRAGIEGLMDFLVDNLVSRSVGVVLRTVVLFVYLLFLVVLLGFYIIAYLFWFGMPLWIVASFAYIFGGF
jgi:hypothetical protein